MTEELPEKPKKEDKPYLLLGCCIMFGLIIGIIFGYLGIQEADKNLQICQNYISEVYSYDVLCKFGSNDTAECYPIEKPESYGLATEGE